MNWGNAFRVIMQARDVARDLSSDDMLGYLGLQKKRTFADYVVPGLGFFAAGIAAGAGIGLLLAPTSGRELRQQIGVKYQDARNRLGASTEHFRNQIVGATEQYTSDIKETAQHATNIDEPGKGPSLM